MKTNIIFLALVVLLWGCKSEDDQPMTTTIEMTPDENIAVYDATFSFSWSSDKYPTDYPSNPHFSPLVGWSHVPTTDFFKLNTLASAGIKSMAETGSTSALENEIDLKIAKGRGLKFVKGSGLSSGTGEITVQVIVDKMNSAVTLATMIAPSPDWYVAVVNETLLDKEGEFIETKTVEALTYDAGTDSGVTYGSANEVTDPQQKITILENSPLGENPIICKVTFKKK